MDKQDPLIAPLLRRNDRLEKTIAAWLDFFDTVGVAVVCETESGGHTANATAREELEKAYLPLARAAEILGKQGVEARVHEAGFLAWSRSGAAPRTNPRLASLSRREREVGAWLAKGKTAAEIGAVLSISPRTVEKHIERIYAKCDVRSHGEFVRLSANEST